MCWSQQYGHTTGTSLMKDCLLCGRGSASRTRLTSHTFLNKAVIGEIGRLPRTPLIFLLSCPDTRCTSLLGRNGGVSAFRSTYSGAAPGFPVIFYPTFPR